MTEGNDRGFSRRQWLAAASGGMALLAGCSGDGGTETPAGEATSTATGTATEAGPAEGVGGVLVDQVGYRQGNRKRAILRSDATSYAVVDTGSGETVKSGEISGQSHESSGADETIVRLAFGDVNDAGRYAIELDDGAERSHEFLVDRSPWGTALAQIGRGFTLSRSGVAIEDPVTGLDIDAGHPQDAEAELYWDDPFVAERDTVDVRGGWYGAGGYGKYTPTGAFAAAHLLLAYEWNADGFTTGQFGFLPGVSDAETSAGVPDVLAEAKYELEWLERMQRRDGSVWQKVAGEEWPGFETAPDGDSMDRHVFGYSTYATAVTAAAMAIATRVYEPYDGEFANRMSSGARNAFRYLEDNPEPEFRFDDGQDGGSKSYRTDSDRHARFWAAAELAKSIADDTYKSYLTNEHPQLISANGQYASWDDPLALGQWAFYTASNLNENQRSTVADNIVEYADQIVTLSEEEGYHVALDPDEYRQGSLSTAVAKANVCLMANEIQGADAYENVALDQIHYALGRSPTGYSYVTGVGENSPTSPHSRLSAATGIDVPGLVVGGPNAQGEDPVVQSLIDEEDPAPARCYVDDREADSVNEPTIEYASQLFFAMAYFTDGASISPP